MIGAPVPGVVNALQVTIPGRSPSVPSVKALGKARDKKRKKKKKKLPLLGIFGYFQDSNLCMISCTDRGSVSLISSIPSSC